MNAGQIIPSHWHKLHICKVWYIIFSTETQRSVKFHKYDKESKKSIFGWKYSMEASRLAKNASKVLPIYLLGIPRVFIQNLLWRFTDNPFWRSVLFIQQQGRNWQAAPCTGERLTYKEQKMERCTLYSSCTYSIRWDLNCPPRSLFGRTAHYGTLSVRDTLPTGILMAL